MIAERDQGVTVQSTLGGKKIAMGFDEDSLEHLMSVMTDLYSDPQLAVIREYSTNAYDAQIEAGVQRPIEVTLPTSLKSYLTIKDYGIGMNADTIERVYSKYGASTKRDTNDQVGMLGLGCKSALTYTHQFSIRSIMDGVCSLVSVSRDERGSTMTVEEMPSDEDNGTEIIIPVNRGHSFGEKAADFFKYWKPGTVLVDGVEPEHVEGLQVSDKLLVIDHNEAGYYSRDRKNYVVMGNVAYPVEADELNTGLSYGYSLVATVDIGSVNFTPSREALMYTAKTRQTLEAVAADLSAAIVQAIQNEVDQAGTRLDAIKALRSWRGVLPNSAQPKAGDYTYNGEAIPTGLKCSDTDPGYLTSTTTSHVLSRTSKMRDYSVGKWPETMWITNYSPDNYTASHKKKMNKYRVDSGLEHLDNYLMFRGAIPASVKKWVPASHIVDWETVKKIKLPRAISNNPQGNSPFAQRLAGSYDFWRNDQWHRGIAADEIDQSKPLFWHHGNRYETSYYAETLMALHPGCTVVALSSNRIDKFQRDFPNAVASKKACEDAAAAWEAKHMTRGTNRIWFGLEDAGIREEFASLEPGKLDDPVVSKLARIAKQDLTKLDNERSLIQRTVYNAGQVRLNGWKNPLQQYPLYSEYLLRQAEDHMYLYLNAAYVAANGKVGA